MQGGNAAKIMTAAVGVALMSVGQKVHAQIRPPETAPAERPADQQSVPVKEVVLYSSGVGYFEHFGSVKGNGFTELHFKTQQINDILKSLLLEDLDHGKVAAVTYGSQEPLSHTLKSFQVDLSSAPPLGDLLSQLRGARVTATLSSGPVTGEILSLEKKQKPAGPDKTITVSVLNLLLPGGAIRPVDLDDASEVRLDDPKLQQELIKALSAVAAARDQESKPVAIHFDGQGERRVRIGYVVEAPVWKASYRLVLNDAAKNEAVPATQPAPAGKEANAAKAQGGSLQGWAIVENQTDSDWENVQLSLVSGRPISFVEDLYQPLYVTRPIVEPELYASLRPQRYTGGIPSAAAAAEEAAKQDGAYFRKSAMLRSEQQQRQLLSGNRARMLQERDAAGVNAAGENKEAIDAIASVSSRASGASIGEFFQYTVGDVTLPRQKSAMIPIITDDVKCARLSIYNAATLADHPLLGARLTNTTGKLLPQGPITVLDGGAYAGDATIEDLPTTQSRLLSYGIDQNVLIHSNDQTNESSLVTARILKGVLELTSKEVFSQRYIAQNKGTSARTLLIEHVKRSGWRLVEPASAMESTDTLYRFEEELPADATRSLTVKEELVSEQGMEILPMDVGQIENYLRTGPIPDAVKKALRQAATLKYALADTERQIQDRQQQINDITTEQSRIRENMKAVSPASDYYKRLEKELDAQETQLQQLKEETKTLRQKLDQQRHDLESYLQSLSV